MQERMQIQIGVDCESDLAGTVARWPTIPLQIDCLRLDRVQSSQSCCQLSVGCCTLWGGQLWQRGLNEDAPL